MNIKQQGETSLTSMDACIYKSLLKQVCLRKHKCSCDESNVKWFIMMMPMIIMMVMMTMKVIMMMMRRMYRVTFLKFFAHMT